MPLCFNARRNDLWSTLSTTAWCELLNGDLGYSELCHRAKVTIIFGSWLQRPVSMPRGDWLSFLGTAFLSRFVGSWDGGLLSFVPSWRVWRKRSPLQKNKKGWTFVEISNANEITPEPYAVQRWNRITKNEFGLFPAPLQKDLLHLFPGEMKPLAVVLALPFSRA